MNTNDWRTQVHPESRQAMVNKIFSTLERYFIRPHTLPGLVQLHNIGARFEEKMYNVASNQSDYLHRIRLKMINFQIDAGTLARSSMLNRAVAETLSEEVGEARMQGALHIMDGNFWKTQLHPGYRQRIVNIIFDTVKEHFQIFDPAIVTHFHASASRLEEGVYAVARSQPEYLQKINLRLLNMRPVVNNPTFALNIPSVVEPSPTNLPPNVVSPTGNISSIALPQTRKRSPKQLAKESIKKRLRTVDYGKILKRSTIENDEESMCPICLVCLKDKDKIRELQKCSHVFHARCLDKWINKGKATCPYCRLQL